MNGRETNITGVFPKGYVPDADRELETAYIRLVVYAGRMQENTRGKNTESRTGVKDTNRGCAISVAIQLKRGIKCVKGTIR